MTVCLIALGSNLGDRAEYLRRAAEALQSRDDIRDFALSSMLETQPIGGAPDQRLFLNAAARFDTSLTPERVLALLQEIENGLGRQRTSRWDARTIDLDLLMTGDEVRDTPRLTLPHPRMALRRFVLEPAAEIAPEMIHPTIGWSVAQLLVHLDSRPDYVALTGVAGCAKEVARRAAEATGATRLTDPITESRSEPCDELSILSARGEALARYFEGDQGSTPTISDFWLNQSLASAAGAPDLSGEDLGALLETWRTKTVAPKLVVLLQASQGAQSRLISHELRRMVTQSQQGPFLLLDADDIETAVQEVAAAVEAIRV